MKILFLLLTSLHAGMGGSPTAQQQETFNWAQVTNVLGVSTTSSLLIGKNMGRKGLRLFNNSSNSIYISTQCHASSSTNLFAIIATFQSIDLSNPVYTGQVCGIRNSGTGNVVVTEFY